METLPSYWKSILRPLSQPISPYLNMENPTHAQIIGSVKQWESNHTAYASAQAKEQGEWLQNEGVSTSFGHGCHRLLF